LKKNYSRKGAKAQREGRACHFPAFIFLTSHR
jgi:hypothetical protein